MRAIQLAKAALYAGARLLMDHLGIDKVDRITLAGAFGSHIDVKYAMVLGMIPDCDLAKVTSAGNAAGTGARIALLNAAARDEIARVVKQVEKVETAVEPQVPGALRRGDGDPAQDRALSAPGEGGRPAGAEGRPRRAATTAGGADGGGASSSPHIRAAEPSRW